MDTNTLAQVFEFFKTYAPWLIIIVATQLIKTSFLDKLVDWLKRLLSIIIPLLISALIWFIFSMPSIDIWTWFKMTLAAWAAAIVGYDFIKAIIGTFTGLFGKKEGD
jgi:uncharacterized membrane protein YkvI